jgi:hypothetical protein
VNESLNLACHVGVVCDAFSQNLAVLERYSPGFEGIPKLADFLEIVFCLLFELSENEEHRV